MTSTRGPWNYAKRCGILGACLWLLLQAHTGEASHADWAKRAATMSPAAQIAQAQRWRATIEKTYRWSQKKMLELRRVRDLPGYDCVKKSRGKLKALLFLVIRDLQSLRSAIARSDKRGSRFLFLKLADIEEARKKIEALTRLCYFSQKAIETDGTRVEDLAIPKEVFKDPTIHQEYGDIIVRPPTASGYQ